LNHPSGGLQALIDLAKGAEVEWLELKATCYPTGGVLKQGENEADYQWHVAKAVVALANSIGGVVLLGVDDKGEFLGLEASDPKGLIKKDGLDAFKRMVISEQVLLPIKGWTTGKQLTVKLVARGRFERLIALHDVRCGDRAVLAIIVDPAPAEFGPIVVAHTKSGKTTEHVYVRKRGDIGQVLDLPRDDPAVQKAHEEGRTRVAQEMGLAWDRFLSRSAPARAIDELAVDIRRYLDDLTDEMSLDETKFIRLDAIERIPFSATKSATGKGRSRVIRDQAWLPDGQPSNGSSRDSDVLLSNPGEAPRQGAAVVLLADCKRGAVLLGNAGTGKSTCFHHLALQQARAWTLGANWPLLVRLGDLSDSLAGALEQQSGIEWRDLAPMIAGGSVTLFLDGLNECPTALHESCRAEISTLLKEFLDARIFISERLSGSWDEFGLPAFEIQAMGHAQQSQLLRAYVNDDRRADQLLEQLRGQRGGESIASSPLLMRIVAAVATDASEIPAGRAALYRGFFATWHKRELSKPLQTKDAFPWSLDEIVRALSELAYRLRLRGVVRCRQSYARDIVTPIVGLGAEAFIETLANGLVLTRADRFGTVGFMHETFQEYLCAEYMAARQHDLTPESLKGSGDTRPGTWAMPLAFAFELVAEPSDALLSAAWQEEPLIVAAALRNDAPFISLPVNRDDWTNGVIRALRGEDVSADAQAIANRARLPPKYPIPQYLLSTLRSVGFWYAAESHEAGRSRLERLRQMLCSGRFPWIELLPHAVQGRPAWADGLGPAQRLLAGVSESVPLGEVLATATVSELCSLRRRNHIAPETLASAWRNAINEDSGLQLEIELIDLVLTESEIISGLLPLYRHQLRAIARHWNLSLRVLNILVRSRVISAREVREESGRVADIVAKASLMNAYRLAKQRVLIRQDFDEAALNRLIYASDPKEWKKNVMRAVEAGLVGPEDLPPEFPVDDLQFSAPPDAQSRLRSSRHAYKVADLENPQTRARIDADLKDKRWKVTVKSVRHDGGFGFVVHGDFDTDLFFPFSAISDPNSYGISARQTLDVVVASRFDRRKEMWGFSVVSGRVVA
jgi:hypothetical protein